MSRFVGAPSGDRNKGQRLAFARQPKRSIAMVDIVHSVLVKTTQAKLFAAVSTKAGIAKWYTADVAMEERLGGAITLVFGDLATLNWEVTELKPPKSIVWSARAVPEDFADTTLRFDVKAVGDAAELRFVQSSFAEQDDTYGMYNYFWGQYMRSLKLALETGVGAPFGSPDAKANGTRPDEVGVSHSDERL